MPLYEKHQLIAAPNQKPIRLDTFVAGRLKNVDLVEAASLAAQKRILVNGEAGHAELLLRPGDEISILSPYKNSSRIEPVGIPLDIVFENKNCLVINKKAGLVLHPGLGNYNNSLLHGLADYYRENSIAALENGLVHRLDKETSGLLVVAKTKYAFQKLSGQFKNRTAGRTYHALVWGHMPAENGIIDIPIGRDPLQKNIIRVFEEGNGGKQAVTRYKVLEQFKNAALLECSLETGRTHQLRIHLAWLGNGVIGDKRYGFPAISPATMISRHALHACSLCFNEPESGEKLLFDVPYPADFSGLAGRLRSE